MITPEHLKAIGGAPRITPLMMELAAAVDKWAPVYGVTHHKALLQYLSNTQIDFDKSQTFEREDPHVRAAFIALSLNPAQRDAFYLAASKL